MEPFTARGLVWHLGPGLVMRKVLLYGVLIVVALTLGATRPTWGLAVILGALLGAVSSQLGGLIAAVGIGLGWVFSRVTHIASVGNLLIAAGLAGAVGALWAWRHRDGGMRLTDLRGSGAWRDALVGVFSRKSGASLVLHSAAWRSTPHELRLAGMLRKGFDHIGAGDFVLGRLGAAIVVAPRGSHTAVIGPTGSAKSTGCLIPSLIARTGGYAPALVGSAKPDVLMATLAARRSVGPVAVFDPAGLVTPQVGVPRLAWSIPAMCSGPDAWPTAQHVASVLGNSGGDNARGSQFFRQRAAAGIAVYLFAAGRSGAGMDTVVAWARGSRKGELSAALLGAPVEVAEAASSIGVGSSDSSADVASTALGLLQPWAETSVVEATSHSGDDPWTPGKFLDDGGTLYLVYGPARLGVVATILLDSVVRETERRHIQTGRALPGWGCSLMLDEAASLGTGTDLPRLHEVGRGWGLSVTSFWQSVAQLDRVYGLSAEERILGSCGAIMVLPPGDPATNAWLGKRLGTASYEKTSKTTHSGGGQSYSTTPHEAPAFDPQAFHVSSQALLLARGLHPAEVTISRYFEDKALKALATPAVPTEAA